jgi:phospholipid-binding lipoprotein MlaA
MAAKLMRSLAARAAAVTAAILLGACATVPPGAGQNPRDPFERVNRQTFAFNDKIDKYFFKPLAQGYKWVLPDLVRSCINNGFANMGEIRNAVNDILQIKPVGAATDTGRLVVNSTIGLAGCFDVAKKMGLERRHEDFGLTLARWGLDTGPYLVLPILGPSDLRDGVGLIPDSYTSPIAYIMPVKDRYIVFGVSLIDMRAELLDATKLIDQAALDRYQFTRDAYFQRRTSLQYEGNPPAPKDEDDSGETGPGTTPTKTTPQTAPAQTPPAQTPPPDQR